MERMILICQYFSKEKIIAKVVSRTQEVTKDRLHRNYLKRKENGKQAEWEQAYKERRLARKAEKQAQLPISSVPMLEYRVSIKDHQLEQRYDCSVFFCTGNKGLFLT